MRVLAMISAVVIGAAAGFLVGYVVLFGNLYGGLLLAVAGAMILGMTVAHLLPRGPLLR
jgi:hypothetical protein